MWTCILTTTIQRDETMSCLVSDLFFYFYFLGGSGGSGRCALTCDLHIHCWFLLNLPTFNAKRGPYDYSSNLDFLSSSGINRPSEIWFPRVTPVPYHFLDRTWRFLRIQEGQLKLLE